MSEQDKFAMMEILTEEEQQEIIRHKKAKKRNYVVGLSLTGVFAIGLIALYILAANIWLIDLENISYITFSYPALVEDGEEQTATIVSIKSDSDYPTEFRIPAEINGYRITAIGNDAFAGCNRLTKVIMTDNITTIGAYAFAGCQNLREIVFSKNIEVLGTNALQNTYFYDNLPNDKVSAIHGILFHVGENMVDENTVILKNRQSTIPNNYLSGYNILYMDDWVEKGDSPIKVWGDGIFANMEGLVYCELPNIETFFSVPINTFKNCTNLEGVSFPDTIIEVDESAFNGCSSLENIEISNQIEDIGSYAFANSGVTNPVLPETLKNISSYAFSGAFNITEIDWPDSLKTISEALFENCTNLTTFNMSSVAYENIISIGSKAFRNTALTTFDIPKNVSLLAESLFAESANLTAVRAYEGNIEYDRHGNTVSTGISRINRGVFNNCTSFDSLILVDENRNDVTPNHEVNIPMTCLNVSGDLAIFGNTAIKKAIIPYNLSSIGYEMFANNSLLDEITIETKRVGNKITGISKIEYRAFYNCVGLTELVIPNTVATIEQGAFENCENIVSLELPQGENAAYKVIRADLFKNMHNLTHLDLSPKINKIETEAFYQNFALDYVVIPTAVASDLGINYRAFNKCRPENSGDKMSIFLNVKENDVSPSKVISGWFDPDTCNVYWKDQWQYVVGDIPTPV